MADLDKNLENIPEEEEYVNTVVISDDEGNVIDEYVEDFVWTAGKNTYALLISAAEYDCECGCEDHDHDHECGCGHDHGDEEEGAAIVAKVVFLEDGSPEYVAPTDEEYEEAMAAYEKMMEEEEE